MQAEGDCLAWIATTYSRFGKRFDPAILAELLTAMGAYASIARSLGNVPLAKHVLAFAFEKGAASSGLVTGWLLWRAAPILADIGYPKVAVASLERSLGIFSSRRSTWETHGVRLSLGLQYLYSGDFAGSLACLSECLHSDDIDEFYQSIALSNLALLYERQQKPEEAIALLDSAEDVLANASRRVIANARWIKARALVASGEIEIGAEIFAGLREDICRYGAPVDPLLLFCDYAGVLTHLGDSRRLRAARELFQEHLSNPN
ncbi:MAG: hypothetical protein AAGM22_32490, partial [Acidobacteriota bacterium]